MDQASRIQKHQRNPLFHRKFNLDKLFNWRFVAKKDANSLLILFRKEDGASLIILLIVGKKMTSIGEEGTNNLLDSFFLQASRPYTPSCWHKISAQ